MQVYAKSRPKPLPDGSQPDWPTLDQHTRDVCAAVAALLGTRNAPTRLARSILRFLKVTPEDFDALWLNTMVAAALHDIGKANDGFQAAVKNPAFPRGEQAIRHEHLSALWIAHPTIAHWLMDDVDGLLDFDVILSAVATHHLKARRDGTSTELGFGGAMSNYAQCRAIVEGIRSTLAIAATYLGKASPGLNGFPTVWKPGKSDFRDALIHRADRVIKKSLELYESRRRLLLGVRSVLIAADAAASGLVRERKPKDWIQTEVLSHPPLDAAYVQGKVIERRVDQLKALKKWDCTVGRDGWSDFQDASASLGRQALLLAPCGAGKTLAAWRWIAATLDQERAAGREYGRVLFLYPTRGTATEGFRDYVSWAPEDQAALVHGTAAYDLAGMFSNPEEADERQKKQFVREENARLFALAQWPKRVFSATVDAFLGAMSHQYAAICLLPVLADSVVVIDEVHSFSESMFAALRCLLERFDVPVLCMTASLPNERRKVLTEELDLELFPRDPEQFEDLRRASDHPRYRVYATTRADAERIAAKKLQEGKRVLWVVNRVDECRSRYRRMKDDVSKDPALKDVPVLCYHSRFRLCDRHDRHEDVVAEFQRKPRRAALAITTQVCEMSLDLDADVLISEIAPVTAIIQRMGRCCREKNPGERFGEVYLYAPEQDLPYVKDDIKKGMTFLTELASQTSAALTDRGVVSQNDLAEKLAALDEEAEPQRYAVFWDSGFWAFPTEFRDGEEFTIDCVLTEDVEKYLSARKGRRPETPGYVVPVPRKLWPLLQADARLVPLMIAPDEFYNEHAGYGLPEVRDGQQQ